MKRQAIYGLCVATSAVALMTGCATQEEAPKTEVKCPTVPELPAQLALPAAVTHVSRMSELVRR